MIPTCRALGIGFVPFSPLGRGFLSGAVTTVENLPADDFRRTLPRFLGDDLQKNLALVSTLEQVAARKGCAASQLALAWILAMGDDLVPIPGTKRRTYLESNAAAADITLTAADMTELTSAFPVGAASGARYPANLGALVDQKRS
ncbi:MAG: aldo/keto reductase [Vicinamibacterales bacterium]